ncbi:MAG: SDR family NAD(P)-dependent oxidoreductase, partial [Variovorax sp.]|nr:SDR family NAD(P)-dependent oxidoreductase [Variovorax sp.]
ALRLASDGARVAVFDIDAEGAERVAAELRALGADAVAGRVDVTSADSCERMIETVVQAFGRLDAMFCNAGIAQVKPFMDISVAEWDATFAVNTKGVFLTMQAAARAMQAQAPLVPNRLKGKIIVTASIGGRYGSSPSAVVIPHYRASKAAVISLTQSAAVALAPHISVNAICPGMVDTDMGLSIKSAWAQLRASQSDETTAACSFNAVLLGRAQTPQDVACVAAFLAGANADFMTGQSLNVDGGVSMN